ncbi:MAG: OmpA family protein [Proteobacteria bacterium]|nr:OmpA family protein [Pseudomonadota bacterium]
MNNLVKIIIAASAVISFSASAQDIKAATPKSAYAQDARGVIVRDTYGLCWRTSYWTPADSVAGCDGAIAAAQPAKPGAKPTPTAEKVTYSADALFDFNKAVLKPEGKEKLDDLFLKLFGLNLEVIVATGYTDTIGSEAYNQKLSVRRAEAVKKYLVEKGVEENRVYTEGKGKSSPVVTDCKGNRAAQIKCQQPNRRVEIEVVGTRK